MPSLKNFLTELLIFCCFAAPAVAHETQRGPAQRVVSLAPHLTELVFAAGAGDRLVGVSAYSDYPAAAQRLPVVARDGKVDIERVLQLKPDLILAWKSGGHDADIRELEQRGLRVVTTEAAGIEDVATLIRKIGALAGTSPIAEERAAAFERSMASLRAQYASRPPVPSFIEIWHSPMMTVNGQHPISSILELCGGINVFAHTAGLTSTISKEQLFAKKPQAVLSLAFNENVQAQAAWKSFGGLKAVDERQVYALDPALLSRMTPRLVQGAAQMCLALEQARQLSARRSAMPNR